MLQRKLGTLSGDFLKFCQKKIWKFLIISVTPAGERMIQAGYPSNVIVTSVSGCCLSSFPSSFLPLFLYFSISVSRSCFRDWFAISSFYSFILSSFPSQEKMLTKNLKTQHNFGPGQRVTIFSSIAPW
jgi:hypothetical protein